MAHKVRVDVSFADLDQYQTMKNQLDGVGLHMDTFVTYCVDTIWNQMLEEHKRQQANAREEQELVDEIVSDELDGNLEQIPDAEGLDIEEPQDGPADNAAQG